MKTVPHGRLLTPVAQHHAAVWSRFSPRTTSAACEAVSLLHLHPSGLLTVVQEFNRGLFDYLIATDEVAAEKQRAPAAAQDEAVEGAESSDDEETTAEQQEQRQQKQRQQHAEMAAAAQGKKKAAAGKKRGRPGGGGKDAEFGITRWVQLRDCSV